MKFKNISLLILMLATFICYSQEYYVTAKSGLNVRNKPSLTGEKIGKLIYQEKLLVFEKTTKTLKIINNGKELNGNWVKIEFKNVIGYIFDGFLSKNKPKYKQVNFDDIKHYLYNKVWVSKDFLTTLNRTKSYWRATGIENPSNVLFYDNDKVNTFLEGQMEETYLKINKKCGIHNYNNPKEIIYRIISINENKMLLKKTNNDEVISYFKVDRPMGNDSNFTIVREGTEIVTKKWFAGTYKLTNLTTKKTTYIKYDENQLTLRIFYNGLNTFESIGIDYKIIKIENETYFVKEITLDYNNEEGALPILSKETYSLIKID